MQVGDCSKGPRRSGRARENSEKRQGHLDEFLDREPMLWERRGRRGWLGEGLLVPDAGAWSNVSLKAGMVSTEISVSESGGLSEQESRVAGEQGSRRAEQDTYYDGSS